MSLPVENAVTLVLVSLGFVSLLVMLVFECWRPGLTHQPGGRGRPRNLNRECCSVVLGDAMLVPLLIIFALGLLIFASAAQEDLCDTSLGYCDTISCVAGNVIWQGYVFMFVMLTVTPIIILNAVMKEAERSICCVNCYSCTCGQYDMLRKGDSAGRKDMLSVLDAFIVWTFLVGNAFMCLTGFLPTVLPGGPLSDTVAAISRIVHLGAVGVSVFAGTLVALLLSVQQGIAVARKFDPQRRCCLVGCCLAVRNRHHRGCGALGYALAVPCILAAGVLFGVTLGQAPKLHSIREVCILSVHEADCAPELGCVWNASEGRRFEQMCVNPDCNRMGAVSTAAEYVLLMLMFMIVVVALPAIRQLVGAPPVRSERKAAAAAAAAESSPEQTAQLESGEAAVAVAVVAQPAGHNKPRATTSARKIVPAPTGTTAHDAAAHNN